MKIISWQSVLTDHQSHTMRALQKHMDKPLVIVSGVKELGERKAQGWTVPDIHDLNVCYLPQVGWWKEGLAILDEHADAVHMFNSMWGDRRFFPLLLVAQWRGLSTVLITEPYAEVGVGYLREGLYWAESIKAKLRPFLYGCAGLLVAKKLLAVFAISVKAEEQFENIGVTKGKIFPFGYFIPRLQVNRKSQLNYGDEYIHMIFVGSIIERKGVYILIKAMQICVNEGVKVRLDIYGSGNSDLLTDVEGVSYQGIIPFGKAQQVIANYDILVLPSLHDGWGVVVNEALLQGIPAIVSDQVGAKALIEKSGSGAVVASNDARALADMFIKISDNPYLLQKWKVNAQQNQDNLEPAYAARFLHEKLNECLKRVKV